VVLWQAGCVCWTGIYGLSIDVALVVAIYNSTLKTVEILGIPPTYNGKCLQLAGLFYKKANNF